MTRKERLMKTLRGEKVDRPAVSFYELDYAAPSKGKTDPYNIYDDPSWAPLLKMVHDKVDRIYNVAANVCVEEEKQGNEAFKNEMSDDGTERRWTTTVTTPSGRVLRSRSYRHIDTNTVWTTEHLLKDVEDFEAYLTLPVEPFSGKASASKVHEAEAMLGDDGIVMFDIADPLCRVAPLFDMGDYTVFAMTERELFRKALDRAAEQVFAVTRAVAEAAPGHIWRIVGPEYAAEPYLPPSLFAEYVTPYVSEMVRIIHRTGGFARVHSHGRLKNIMEHIIATGCDALDPLEPPHQGDVTMRYLRENYGKQLVLFGNLEITDIENLPAEKMREKVLTALDEGTAGDGRGMVLMPSACPYGRQLSPRTLHNYEVILETLEEWSNIRS